MRSVRAPTNRNGGGADARYLALPRRVEIATLVVVLVVSAAAWLGTIRDADSMQGMAMGLGQVGTRVVGSMGAALFLAMWVTMMTAMMLPVVAPVVLAHLAISRRRGDGIAPTLAFVAGYLAVWSAIGIVPLTAFTAFAHFDAHAASPRWLSTLAAAILLIAGAYQFTPWKRRCLEHCQSPFAFVARHDFQRGARGALRAGIVYGAYCLGCCWALMLVLLAVGMMNVAWMALLFVLIYVEKTWRHGLALAHIAGGALIALAMAIVVYPALLELVSR